MRLCPPGLLLPLLLASAGDAAARPNCAATLGQLERLLGEQALPQTWTETTMDDGKPLVMSIAEGDGSLLLAFTKTGEGLWAESTVTLCESGAKLEARFSRQQIRLGPAAGWLLRSALRNGGKFIFTKLAANELHIATRGWSGKFSAVTP